MRKLIFFIIPTALTIGCGNPELTALRESMHQSTATIRKQHLEWSKAMATGGALPHLTEGDAQLIERAHREYEALVEESRKSDSGRFSLFGIGR